MTEFTASRNPLATIVVIGLRDAPSLLNCLRSVAANVLGVPYQVHVVLCDPTDRLRAELEREVSGVEISPFRANLGFARAANFAAARCRTEYIVLLNDDCRVEPGWLESLLDTAERRPRAGLVCSKFLHPDGSLQESGSVLWSDGSTSAVGDGSAVPVMDFERRVDYGSGGSLLVRRDVWSGLGGLPDCYYPAYYEDLDFSLAAAEAGWESWYQPKSVVIHERSASSTVSVRSFIWDRAAQTFRGRWGHVLSGRAPNGHLEDAVWKAMGSPTRVLVIDDRIPEPAKGSGFGRMFDTLSSLAREGDLAVTFAPRMVVAGAELRVPGVRVVENLEAHLSTEGVAYDVIVVSRPHNGQLYRELLDRLCPDSLIVYDAEALFHRRLEMQAEMAPSETRPQLLEEAAWMRGLEADVLAWADHAICISALEADAARLLAATPVEIVSPLLEAPRPTVADFRHRAGIGFVAGWAAGPGSPNCDALQWFGREVLPRVRVRIPGVVLRVTGYDPPPDVRWLAGPAVEFTGEVRELARFYDSVRVAVSPTRFGAGVKIKTVEAVQYGVPVVCTEEAATGLPARLRQAVWVCDDPAAFADAVVELLSDERTWELQRSRCLRYSEELEAAADQRQAGTGWPSIIRRVVAGGALASVPSGGTR